MGRQRRAVSIHIEWSETKNKAHFTPLILEPPAIGSSIRAREHVMSASLASTENVVSCRAKYEPSHFLTANDRSDRYGLTIAQNARGHLCLSKNGPLNVCHLLFFFCSLWIGSRYEGVFVGVGYAVECVVSARVKEEGARDMFRVVDVELHT